VEHGDAETTDGVHWVLYVAHEQIVAHTGLSEIRYGTWHAGTGLKRAAVRGTARGDLIEQVGSCLVEALERNAHRVPFPPADRHECWLLEAGTDQPLALLASTQAHGERNRPGQARWYPSQASVNQFNSEHGDARQLAALVNDAAGAPAKLIWVKRSQSGYGYDDDGTRVPRALFPELLVREHWNRPKDAALVQDFIAWQAPWLLQLPDLTVSTRRRLEQAAWARPRETDRVHRLFTRVLDPQGLTVTRVKARLMAGRRAPERQPEPFLPFYLE
jgi:hypothetical protein